MMTNVGIVDAALRIGLAALLFALSYGYIASDLHPSALWWMWIGGLALGFSGLLRYCPLYALIGTDSCAPYPPRDR
jgi:hypothetical protein